MDEEGEEEERERERKETLWLGEALLSL